MRRVTTRFVVELLITRPLSARATDEPDPADEVRLERPRHGCLAPVLAASAYRGGNRQAEAIGGAARYGVDQSCVIEKD